MDFLKLVATRMFEDWKFLPDNPRNVQIYMRDIILVELDEDPEPSVENYILRLQGHIELQNHINLFGEYV